MPNKRHFTVVEGNKEHGLFVGRTPSSVAKKVVSKLSKGNKVVFSLREITQGSKKKTYGPYEGYKKKLKEPRIVGDRVYKYESVVRKIEKKGGGDVVSPVVVLRRLDKNGRITSDFVEITKIKKSRFALGMLGKLSKEESKYTVNINYENELVNSPLESVITYLKYAKKYLNLCDLKEALGKDNKSWQKLNAALQLDDNECEQQKRNMQTFMDQNNALIIQKMKRRNNARRLQQNVAV